MSIGVSTNKPITQKQIDKTQRKGYRKGTNRAMWGSSLGSLATLPVGLAAVAGLKGANKNLTEAGKTQIADAAKKILDVEGLAARGVKLIDKRSSEAGELVSSMMESVPFSKNVKKVMQSAIEMAMPEVAAAKGNNAFFGGIKGAKCALGNRMYVNEVIVNMDKLPTAVFHELGHAANANKSKFWGIMQNLRTPSMLLASGIALYAAFTRNSKPKEENNGQLTTGQKVNNFVRKNSGKLAFAAMIPVLAEEGMATIRGNGWAKKLLSSDLAKKVTKGNAVAYLSYLASAVGLGLTAFLATKIKDKHVAKTEAKVNELKTKMQNQN